MKFGFWFGISNFDFELCEKTMKDLVFSTFDCDPEIVMEWLQQHSNPRYISPRKTIQSTFFPWKKKFLSKTPKIVVLAILRPNLRPLLGIENFFSVNLTYSYTFLGWNLTGITMYLESLHNYFRIPVKTRKTIKNLVFPTLAGIPEKGSPEKWSPEKWSPRKMALGKNGARKNGPQKIGPRESQKRKIVGWTSSIRVCVWNVRMWSIYENPKLDNKSSWTPLVFYSLVHM